MYLGRVFVLLFVCVALSVVGCSKAKSDKDKKSVEPVNPVTDMNIQPHDGDDEENHADEK